MVWVVIELVCVWGDFDEIVIVVCNLIDNVLCYGCEGGWVEIMCDGVEEVGWVRLWIVDDGLGVLVD